MIVYLVLIQFSEGTVVNELYIYIYIYILERVLTHCIQYTCLGVRNWAWPNSDNLCCDVQQTPR